MRRLSLVVTLPILLIAVVFSVTNRQIVPVRLWPLRLEVELPLYLMALAALALGLVAGVAAAWLAAGKLRQRLRRERRRSDALESELVLLRHKRAQEKLEKAPVRPTAAPALAGSVAKR